MRGISYIFERRQTKQIFQKIPTLVLNYINYHDKAYYLQLWEAQNYQPKLRFGFFPNLIIYLFIYFSTSPNSKSPHRHIVFDIRRRVFAFTCHREPSFFQYSFFFYFLTIFFRISLVLHFPARGKPKSLCFYTMCFVGYLLQYCNNIQQLFSSSCF